MSFGDTLRSVLSQDRPSAEQLGVLAREALAELCEDQALPLLEEASRGSRDARLWQWKALLERGLDDHAAGARNSAQGRAIGAVPVLDVARHPAIPDRRAADGRVRRRSAGFARPTHLKRTCNLVAAMADYRTVFAGITAT